MRQCYRQKKLSFGYVQRFHALDWKKAQNFVVKSYKTEGDAARAFDDVRLQAEALYADKFNELQKPPKPIHVIAACVWSSSDDDNTPALCAERFIDGADRFGRGFVKWAPTTKFTSVLIMMSIGLAATNRLKGFPR